MNNNSKIIITGGPGYGKSTIIKALERKGYAVQHEFGREVIQHALETGGDKTPWQDVIGFSKEVLAGRVKQFQSCDAATNFLDRGIPDIIAFLHKDKIAIDKVFEQASQNYRYFPTVFITPPWKEIFVNDAERKEQYDLSQEIHEYITSTYSNLGYTLIEIPKTNVANRMQYVIEHLQKTSTTILLP